MDTFGRIGARCRVELHIYSQYEGDDQALDIVQKAVELTHHAALTVAGWSVANVVRAPVTLFVEDVNGIATRHAIAPLLVEVQYG